MKDELVSFLSGAAFAITGNASWLFNLQVMPHNAAQAADLAFAFGIKVIGTMIIGVIGGIAGLLGKDIYSKLKNRYDRIDEENK